ncbi:DUF6234 family protein [Streptomyces argenteolus]|uniref:DUF6234 family protein n=1 Tax=Streptomyces argenteolus TaxID=67274 RepID=A0ABW6XET9_9ACTN
MDLPTAPAAFDDSVRPRAGRGADVGTAVGLLLLEVLALSGTFGVWLMSGVSLDPSKRASPGPLEGCLLAAGVVGTLTVVAAVIAVRSRAVVTAWIQCFLAVVVVAGVTGPVTVQRHEKHTEHPAPLPVFTGEAGCRSGGDTNECAGTGG